MFRSLLAATLASTLLLASAPSTAAPSLCTAVVGNLVANCGFETGSFTGWTTQAASSGSFFAASTIPASGAYAGGFGATAAIDDAISQVLATVPGQTYSLAFSLFNAVSGSDHFNVSWNGTTLLDLLNAAAFPYTSYQFTVTGTGSDTLRFAGYDAPAGFHVDDISVVSAGNVATPEPATLALLAVALAGLAARRRA